MATGILEMVYVQYERTWPCWGTGAGAASECQELLSFFLSLSFKQAEKLHSGRWRPREQLCYEVSLQDMVSVLRGRNGCSDTEPQTGRPPPTRGWQGRFQGPGPQSPMVTEPWTWSPWESLPSSPAGHGPFPGRSALGSHTHIPLSKSHLPRFCSGACSRQPDSLHSPCAL